LKAEPESIELI